MPLRIYPVKNELEALREKIKPLKDAFDLLDDHAVITNADGIILYANKAVERNTGYSRDMALGKNPGDLWGGGMPKDFYERMWHTIKTEKKPFVGEVQNKRKDGQRYWQELHISPVLDETGNVRFFIGIEPNITDRKEKEKFREEFVSMIGHQLRNPLAAIRWTIELMTRSARLNEEDKRNLESMYKENKNLADFVSDLLMFSRVGAGEPKKETFDLGSEIERLIAEVKTHNPHAEFSFRKTGRDFSLHADKSLALQVFSNLIYNAAEYGDPSAGRVSVILERDAGYCRFSCENNGPPIPAQDQNKIFSKFFRASAARELKKKGTGLGLFLVKMICDKLRWEVSFKSPASENGTGTIFFIHIPYSINK